MSYIAGDGCLGTPEGKNVAVAKRDNVLYSIVRRKVGNALDLEYAIRASESISAGEMRVLRELNDELREFWLGLEASPGLIKREALIDLAWDVLQVGFPLARVGGRDCSRYAQEMIGEGLARVQSAFSSRLHLLKLPASRFYRISDLLAGNDIPDAIRLVDEGLQATKRYGRHEEPPLRDLGLLLMREPIRLHPAFRYEAHQKDDRSTFRLEVDLTGHFDVAVWHQQLNEFQYQYSVHRESMPGRLGRTATDLRREFLELEHKGSQSASDFPKINGLIPVLMGLHCWDRHKQGGLTLDSAMEETLSLEGAVSGWDALKDQYRGAASRIKELCGRFQMGSGAG